LAILAGLAVTVATAGALAIGRDGVARRRGVPARGCPDG
jgi:hypothetical protein